MSIVHLRNDKKVKKMKNNIKYLIFVTVVSLMTGCSSTKINESEIGSSSRQITSKAYYPTKEEIAYTNILPANSANWCQVLRNAPSKSTVLLEDGEYEGGCTVKNKSYITIKAAHKYGVVYTGHSYFLELQDKNHHINLLNIEATPTTGDSNNYDAGLFKAHGYGHFDNHHIYIKDCWIHDADSGIETGPRVHDITVDKCLIHDIKKGYAWYALGWHLTLSRSVIYHLENDGMMIRGYYPLNRYWDFEEVRGLTIDITQEDDIESLPKEEWTHRITGNFFGEGYGREAARSWERGSAIAFYSGRGNNDGDDAYLAPQNVLIEDNTFYNITPSIAPKSGEVFDGAIAIDGEKGFSLERKDAQGGLIKGTVIQNNVSNVKIIKSFWDKPDMSLITQKNNTSWDTGLLEKAFYERIAELKNEG